MVLEMIFGIGSDQCANCIDRVISQYQYVLRKLNNMDTSTVTESYAKTHNMSEV